MRDLIYRQLLKKRMYEEAFEKDSSMQRWDSGCWIRYKLFENILNEMPSAEPEWIPMTERKPEVGQDVLITSDNGHVLAVTYAHDVWSGENYFDWIPRFMGMGYLPEKEVVAWMPLPKPYQEGKDASVE